MFCSLYSMEQATGQVTQGSAFGRGKITLQTQNSTLKAHTSYEENSKMFTEKLKKMISPALSEEQEKKIYQAWMDYYKSSKIYLDRQRELRDSTLIYVRREDVKRDSLIKTFLTEEQYKSLVAAREQEREKRKKQQEQILRLNEGR